MAQEMITYSFDESKNSNRVIQSMVSMASIYIPSTMATEGDTDGTVEDKIFVTIESYVIYYVAS